MKALRLEAWHSQPLLREVPDPEPGPGEVVIQVGGAGACHSDLHLMHEFEDGVLPWAPPFTLGHENAGWVHLLGDGVSGFEPGQPVAVSAPGAAALPALPCGYGDTTATAAGRLVPREAEASGPMAGWPS